MPVKKETKIVRATLNKALREKYPLLYKKARSGVRVSAAALALLSPTLRASVLTALKDAQGSEQADYDAKELGQFLLDYFSKR